MDLTLSKQALVFMCLQYRSFENNVGKEEIARNQHFLLSLQSFVSFHKKVSNLCYFDIIVWKCFYFGQVQNFVVLYKVKTSRLKKGENH